MKERKLGKRFIRKGAIVEVQLQPIGKNCSACVYFNSKKCIKVECCDALRRDDQNVIFIDITNTFSESALLLLERGLLKL